MSMHFGNFGEKYMKLGHDFRITGKMNTILKDKHQIYESGSDVLVQPNGTSLQNIRVEE